MHHRMINVTNLRSFVAVVRAGSFRAASQRLHVSQPALTRQVRDLETTYGVALLKRTKKGSIPTDFGRSVFDTAAEIFAELGRLETVLRNNLGGTIHLRAVEHVTLPDIVFGIRSGLPHARLHVSMGASVEIEEKLLRGEIDLRLLTLDEEHSPELDVYPLGNYDLLAFVPNSHALKGARRISVFDLADMPLVIAGPKTQTRRTFERRLHAFGLAPRVACEIDNGPAICGMAARLNTVGILSDNGYDTISALNCTRFQEREMTISVHLAARRNRVKGSLTDVAYHAAATLLAGNFRGKVTTSEAASAAARIAHLKSLRPSQAR